MPIERLDKRAEELLWAEEAKSPGVPGDPKKFPIYRKTDRGTILVPRFIYMKHLRRKSDRVVIKERPLDNLGFEFQGEFWDEQVPGVKNLVHTLSIYHGAFGKGRCGTGKTVIGSYLLSRVKSDKSAVLVNQTNLAEQWAAQIKDHLPNATFSFIMPLREQRKIYDKLRVKRPDPMVKEDTRGNVVIAMAQSVWRRAANRSPVNVTFLIVDEAHRFSAPEFAKSIFNFTFRYSLALTATDERRDGLEWVFKGILGTREVQLAGKRMDAKIVAVHAPLADPIYINEHKITWCRQHHQSFTEYSCRLECPTGDYNPNGCGWERKGDKINFTQMSVRLSKDRAYNEAVARSIVEARRRGHQILVFSKYKEHLERLRTDCIDKGVKEKDTALYFGGMDKDKCLKPRVTFATYGVAEHGLDCPWKNVAVLALPITKPEQVTGRIERVMNGKPDPVVIDFLIRSARFFDNQWKARLKFYRSKSYEVTTGDLETLRVALRESHKGRRER